MTRAPKRAPKRATVKRIVAKPAKTAKRSATRRASPKVIPFIANLTETHPLTGMFVKNETTQAKIVRVFASGNDEYALIKMINGNQHRLVRVPDLCQWMIYESIEESQEIDWDESEGSPS